MPSVGFGTWYQKKCPTVFRVRNIAPNGKRIRLFKYPIKNGMDRDLMEIPYVSEADIRHSLLKGELFMKIVSKEIIIIESNIDLLQFDPCQKKFLEDAGVTVGLEVDDGYSSGLTPYLWRNEIELIGATNSSNTTFMIPGGEKFIDGDYEGNEFHIIVEHNGRRLIQDIDFIIQESGGVGTGYDTIKIISFVPNYKSKLITDYVVENPLA